MCVPHKSPNGGSFFSEECVLGEPKEFLFWNSRGHQCPKGTVPPERTHQRRGQKRAVIAAQEGASRDALTTVRVWCRDEVCYAYCSTFVSKEKCRYKSRAALQTYGCDVNSMSHLISTIIQTTVARVARRSNMSPPAGHRWSKSVD
jgi:hypothetical protein